MGCAHLVHTPQPKHNEPHKAQAQCLDKVCNKAYDVAAWQKLFLGVAGSASVL